jgi:hypothetical protein
MKTKICTKCGIEKELSKFAKAKTGRFGVRGDCKECNNLYGKQHYLETIEPKKHYYKQLLKSNPNHNKEKYKKYIINTIYYHIKSRCENPRDKAYRWYGNKGIKCQITKNELQRLWNRDKAWLLKQASIDRKNVKKNYTFENCQFIEMDINRIKDRHKLMEVKW